MAVSYLGRTLIRPNNGGKYPLILRNPQDVTGAHAQDKLGPNTILKFGPADYRMWVESVVLGSNTSRPNDSNWGKFARSGSGWSYELRKDTEDIKPFPVGNWENGEFCPTCWWYDEHRDDFRMLYHGGNNGSTRRIGLMTAPRLTEGGYAGAWTRSSNNPVIDVGGSGATDERNVADACVIRLRRDKYICLYRGSRLSDSKDQIHLATSTNQGDSWTKYGSNPVIALGTGNAVNGSECGWGFVDTDGRIHFWYVGRDGSSVMRILYGFSDDEGQTWTTDPSQPARTPSGTSTDPDAEIGDTIGGLVDEGLILINFMNSNIASYTDGRGRLEGRGQYWLPHEAVSTPARPGRVFSGTQRMDVNSGATLLGSTVGTIYVEFKLPPISGSESCEFYTEWAAFNIMIYIRVNNSDGSLEMNWRTPTGIANFRVKGRRYDDGQFHWAAIRRTATNAFELVADGRVIGTNSTTVGTSASTPTICLANWHPTNSDVGSIEPCQGVLRRVITIAGTAWTVAQLAAIWNEGRGGVAPPNTPTLSVKLGSGGAAGPDAAQDGATYGASVGAGSPIVVNAEMSAPLLPRTVIRTPQLAMVG